VAQGLEGRSREELTSLVERLVARAPPGVLPLQEGLRQGSFALMEDLTPSVLSLAVDADGIRAKLGIHYRSLIAGCQCDDDPTPPDTLPEYCEVWCLVDPEERIRECVLAEA
jgi:hypothetical protein